MFIRRSEFIDGEENLYEVENGFFLLRLLYCILFSNEIDRKINAMFIFFIILYFFCFDIECLLS